MRFELPTIELEYDCKEYIQEHNDNGESKVSGDGEMSQFDDFSFWIKDRENSRNNVNIQSSFVPDTTFLVYDEQRLIGMITIRHHLNDKLFKLGGHIGYSIRPSERRKGYGKAMLNIALDYCKNSLNLDKVLLTCDKNNEASKRVIMGNNGLLENVIYDENMNRYTERYWIYIN